MQIIENHCQLCDRLIYFTDQIAQVIGRSLLVREVWGSYPEPIKSPHVANDSPPLQP